MKRLEGRIAESLHEREKQGLERRLRAFDAHSDVLNLADNDYFRLARSPELAKAAKRAIDAYGLSSSASPLITGFGPAHESLLNRLKAWHDFPCGMVWNTGYAANQALLSKLPQKGDVILADRLIHNSMIAGILASGARLIRYEHCSVTALEALLEKHAGSDRQVFVITESVFSMDGDYPDLSAISALKDKYDFFWMVDEAHALGWYGERGSGLVEQFGCGDKVDALVGTLGKALGSTGAYTLFRDENLVRYLCNHAGEFIYSTYLSPVQAVAAECAVDCLESMGQERKALQELSSAFRKKLQDAGFETQSGDSPIVPVLIGEVEEVLRLGEHLRSSGVLVGTIRPPTVPEGTSRLRISLNAKLTDAELDRVIELLLGVESA